jgi:zinc and cadmium transporter
MLDTSFVWVLAFSLAGSVGAAAGGGLIVALPEPARARVLPTLLSYAAGSLLGAAFLGMLPRALESVSARPALSVVLAGLVGFFLLEKAVLWRHCHDDKCEVHGASAPLLLVGDGLHNFVDGVVIGAAFVASVPLGIATSLAVIGHEIPQELGDVAVLLHCGYSRRRAYGLNLLASTSTIPGACLGYFALDAAHGAIPYVLAVSAASFIYIAIADVVPSLHVHRGRGQTCAQLAAMLAGIATIAIVHSH